MKTIVNSKKTKLDKQHLTARFDKGFNQIQSHFRIRSYMSFVKIETKSNQTRRSLF